MVHKHEKGSGSVAKRLLGLCLALVMLCGVFVPTFASVADQTNGTELVTVGGADEQQPAAPAEGEATGDEGEKNNDAGNVSNDESKGDAKDEPENTGDSTGDTGDTKDENTGDVKDDTTGDGETKDEAKDESKDAKDEDVKDADESDAADANAANGIATYAAPNTVTDGIANNSNITVKLFDYNANINPTDGNETWWALYFFNNYNSEYSVDGNIGNVQNRGGQYYGSGSQRYWYPSTTCDSNSSFYNSQLTGKTLQNDYPTYNNRSLRYLFDGTVRPDAVTQYNAASNSGLFKLDEDGYLVYDAAENAAYFDKSTNKFVLYEGVVRPAYINDDADEIAKANFLPFNGANQFTQVGNTKYYTVGNSNKNSDNKVDLWFGMTVEFEFLMPENGNINGVDGNPMKFEFKGDDDVWVFIDGVRVLDIGGDHSALEASIDFSTGVCDSPYIKSEHNGETRTLKELFTEALGADQIKEADWKGGTFADFSTHTLKFFYLERGGNISYCKLKFNMPTLPAESLTIGKELTTSGAAVGMEEYLKQTYDYKFRVLKSDGTPLYIPPTTKYTLVDSVNYKPIYENGVKQQGEVQADGYIYLKAGQYAQFENMSQYADGTDYDYIVEEAVPDNVKGQYNGVSFDNNGTTGETKVVDKKETDFTGYRTGTLSALQSRIVIYKNNVDAEKLGKLSITKTVTGDGAPADAEFTMNVTLGGKPLAAGTKYKIGDGDEVYTVSKGNEGKITLKAGETAVIENVLAGTTFTVSETLPTPTSAYEFECKNVTAEQVDKENKTDVGGAEVDATNKVASGVIRVNGAVSIVVTNQYTPKTTDVTVKKIVAGNLGDTSKKFNFAWHYGTSNSAPIPVKFELGHNGEMVLKDIPIGAVVTVTEDTYPGYVTTWTKNGEATSNDGREAKLTVAAPDTSKPNLNTITFTNTKDSTVDNGIFLDSMPYIMALVIVAGGAAVFFLRRRKKSED